jgi:hypothetical protein
MLSENLFDNRPNLENIKKLGEDENYIFQALAYMGEASHFMAWANTVIENEKSVPEELKEQMKQVNEILTYLKEKLRQYNKGNENEKESE